MMTIADNVRREADRQAQLKAVVRLSVDLFVPLGLYYGLRLLGVGQWGSLMVGAASSLVFIILGALIRRRLEHAAVFALILITAGTAVGWMTADEKLLMARGSWLTAAVGLYCLATLLAPRPLLYGATMSLMPPAAAANWRRDWETSPTFRRALRIMTLAFGLAFLIDATARMIMAYTLPLDLVPLLSNVLLVITLSLIVFAGRAYARRAARRST